VLQLGGAARFGLPARFANWCSRCRECRLRIAPRAPLDCLRRGNLSAESSRAAVRRSPRLPRSRLGGCREWHQFPPGTKIFLASSYFRFSFLLRRRTGADFLRAFGNFWTQKRRENIFNRKVFTSRRGVLFIVTYATKMLRIGFFLLSEGTLPRGRVTEFSEHVIAIPYTVIFAINNHAQIYGSTAGKLPYKSSADSSLQA